MDSIWSKFVMKQLVWTFKQFKPWFTIQNETFQTNSTSYELLMTPTIDGNDKVLHIMILQNLKKSTQRL
jgi:hypothetical protein